MEENSGYVEQDEQEIAPIEQIEQDSVSDIEKEALENGWIPEDRYHGPGKWVDAETFVRRGREILPIVQGSLKKERERTRRLESELAEVKQAQQEWMALKKKELEQQLDSRLAELKAARKDAVETGNGEQLNAIDDELHELRQAKSQQQPTQKPIPQVDPVFLDWVERPENRWYKDDGRARIIADMIGLQLFKTQGLQGEALYDAVAVEMRKTYAPLQQQRRTPVDSGRSGGTTPRRKVSYDSLPLENRQAVDLMMKRGLIKSPDEYIAVYEEELLKGQR